MFKNWPLWWKVVATIGTALVGMAGIVSAFYAVRAYHYPPNPPAQTNAAAGSKKERAGTGDNNPVKRYGNDSANIHKPSPIEVVSATNIKPMTTQQTVYSTQTKAENDKPVMINKNVATDVTSLSHNKTESNNQSVKNIETTLILERAIITISGSNNYLQIKQSSSNSPFGGSKIAGSNASRILYVPKGQEINLIVSGDNNLIKVAESLLEYISVRESGSNNSIGP